MAVTDQGGALRIVRLGAVGSTNVIASDAATAGERGPVWFVAERQTNGRGRRGRGWVSEPGNLYATHLGPAPTAPEALGILPLGAAVALAEAIGCVTGLDDRIRLKWPNDVLVDGAKVSGILLEARHGAPGTAPLVIAGFGVNCIHAPKEMPYPVTSLASSGAPIGPDRLLPALAGAFAKVCATLDATAGVARVRERWLARAVGIGAPILVRFDTDALEGIFAGLDPLGRLVLDMPNAPPRTIAAGDVFPLAPARAADLAATNEAPS